jgi:glucose-6-phosphate isomerase
MPMNIFFADTVDPHYIVSLTELIENALKQDKDILLNVVTKSGTTTETIANFEIFLDLLKKYRPDNFADFVVAITDHGSPLYQLAQDNKFSVLAVPEKVGGRFSVFSAVGQFALGMLNLNVKELLEGAQSGVVLGTSLELKKNIAAVNALIKYEHLKKNQITINDLFVFSVQLESLGKWYRQLMGESLGKEFDKEGNKVNTGITPTVSVGSIDLHSVGQLYLGGPYDKFINFLSVDTWNQAISVPKLAKFDKLVSKIQGKSLAAIMHAILEGVKIAYKKNKRPFCSLVLPRLSPYYIGQLMQLYMLEIVYLGSMLQIDPFNQPNVESYKEETRKLL